METAPPAGVFTVIVAEPGASHRPSPQEIETEITDKIEESVNAIAGLKTLTSRSLEGKSIVIAEFELSVASAVATQDVREKVQQVRAAFRSEIKEPLIQRFNPDDQDETYSVSHVSTQADGSETVSVLYNGRTATCKGVRPLGSRASLSAPLARSFSTSARWPRAAAAWRPR